MNDLVEEFIRNWERDPSGLDIHTVSAYALVLRYLNPEAFKRLLRKDVQERLLSA